MENMKLIIFVIILFLPINLGLTDDLFSKSTDKKNKREITIFPDEYSDLDDIPTPKTTKDENILKTLERARQRYLQALTLIEKGDTTSAAKYFEIAINILNPLVSYPGIDKNDDFTDLAQSIIEDYESFVQSIDNLDENSSMFIIRDKLFEKIESPKSTTTIIQPPIEIKKQTQELIKRDSVDLANNFTIPLVDNEYVQKNISFLTQDKVGKKFIKNSLERSTKWFPMFKRIAKEENVPEEIIYLAMIESALNPNAVSRAKAVGMWQFIRSTGEMYGLNANSSVWVDERRDPEKSTRAAMRHLKDLYNNLGDWHLAIAAYNCGISGVKRAIAKSKFENPSFWELREFLPKETRNYVPFYIATAKVSMNLAEYGINTKEFNYLDEYKYETYTLNEPISLKALAKCAGTTLEHLQNLNPELLMTTTPPDVSSYTIKIPQGTRELFAANLSTLAPEEKKPWITHKVARKETIASIAKYYGIPESVLLSANNLSNDRTKLKSGTTLLIPVDAREFEETLIASNQTESEQQTTTTSNNGNENQVSTTKDKESFITHNVSNGENLYTIAQKYGVRLSDLRMLNNIPYDKDDIEPGTTIKIAKNVTTSEAPKEPVIKKLNSPVIIRHNVRPGETLAQIADDYNVSIESIKKLNNLKENKIIGSSLKIIVNPSQNQNKKLLASDETSGNNRKTNEPGKKKISYKVKSGDNISNIAAKFGVTESQLKSWNSKKIKGSTVYSGTYLTIYQENVSKGSSAPTSKGVKKVPKYYTVKRGDTISEIANRFGVSTKSIKQKNKNLTDKNLKAGQKIRIQ
jgi:membrane-bound lytic murein transglycosylase D